jgi:hypothetical protein
MLKLNKNEFGQATTEFIIVTSLLILFVFALLLFLPTFSDYCWRILSLVALDYP